MNVLIVSAGYSLFDAKDEMNSYLAFLSEEHLSSLRCLT